MGRRRAHASTALVAPIQIDEYSRLLYYQPGYTPDFVRSTLSSEGLEGLHVFSQLAEDTPSDLEFLREFSFLEQLAITAMPRADFAYGFLSDLKALERFSLNVQLLPGVKTNPLEFGQVPQLKSLNLSWRSDIRGLAALTRLETLGLVEYRAEDLRAISGEMKLKHLQLKTASLRSVAGIESQRELETLELGACTRLRDLSHLAALPKLRKLTLAACPKLTDLGPLAALPVLDDLTLEDCPRLASIRPLADLGLERLTMSGRTDIGDGDTSPARGVRELNYYHREHYNHRLPTPLADQVAEENLRKILGHRGSGRE